MSSLDFLYRISKSVLFANARMLIVRLVCGETKDQRYSPEGSKLTEVEKPSLLESERFITFYSLHCEWGRRLYSCLIDTHLRNIAICLSSRASLLLIGALICVTTVAANEYENCIVRQVENAPNEENVGAIRSRCSPYAARATEAESAQSMASRQTAIASVNESLPLSSLAFTPHFLPNFFSYSTFATNQQPFLDGPGNNAPVEDTEAVFQVSFRAPIVRNLVGSELDVYFAYTARSWWQIANDKFSSPFRETNYMPEVFFQSDADRELLGMMLSGWSLGLAHESNGREQGFSRSWNRVLARAGFRLSDDISI